MYFAFPALRDSVRGRSVKSNWEADIINLHLTAEQIEFRDTVRAFVRDDVKPVTLHPRRLEPFDKPLLTPLLAAASSLGMRAMCLSEVHGGAGADGISACIVVEELAQGDADIAVICAHTLMLAPLVFDQWLTDEQRGRYLPPFHAQADFHLAYAAVNGDAGLAADYHRPRSLAPPFAFTADRDGAGWVVQGELSDVANAGVARLFVVQAESPQGKLTLLVPRDAVGITVVESPLREGASVRWSHGAPGKVVLSGCRVSDHDVLPRGDHAEYRRRCAPLIAAANIGVGQAAFEAAVDYTRLRRQGGRKTIEHQPIGLFHADMAIKLETARNLAWKAAWTLDHPDAVHDCSVSGLPLHWMACAHAAELMVSVTERAAECFGAMGVMRDMPLQKYVDDTLRFRHGAGGAPAAGDARLLVAEAIAGYTR